MYKLSIDLHVVYFNAINNNNPIIVSCRKICNTPVARNRRIRLEWFNDNGIVFQNYFSKIKCNFHHKTLCYQNDIIERMLC